jgi:hypothetical protein
MERIEKIRSIINNWRQQFKTSKKTKYITSRRANRKFLNMLKGRRNITRWRRRKRQTNYSRDLYQVSPSAPPMITPTAPPMYVFSDHNMPH